MTWGKNVGWATAIITTIILVISTGVSVWGQVATDKELAVAVEGVKSELHTEIVVQQDIVKNIRTDRIDEQIFKIDNDVRFGNLQQEEKEFQLLHRATLTLKKQNILEDKE
jgi:hypothetical protein